MKKLSIIYVGSLDPKSNSFMRFKTLSRMVQKTKGINSDLYISGKLFFKLHHHLNIGPGIIALNKKLLTSIKKETPDVLFIDNKPYITPIALKKIKTKYPHIKIINLITDDPFGRYKLSWKIFRRTARFYDMHFVQRAINISELKAIGARHADLCYRSFDPEFHRRIILNKDDLMQYKTQVGFIGTYESIREEYIVHLIKNGVPVSVTGDGWRAGIYWDIIKPYYKGKSIYGDEYIKTINGMDIALHFLRRANRDEQDSRTYEIPACGTFMLAESSEVHLSLFEDGKEAVFFSSKEDMLEKVKYYLKNSGERNIIAQAGYERCLKSDYSHAGRLKEVLNKINELPVH